MTRLPGTYVLLEPPTFVVDVLDDDNAKAQFTYATDCFPRDGKIDRGDRITEDIIDFHGSYWVRERNDSGVRTSRFELLTAEEFRAKYGRQMIEYGLQMIGRPRDVIEIGGNIEDAESRLKIEPDRILVCRNTFEVSDWEVI